MTTKQLSPNVSMRFSNADKTMLTEVSSHLCLTRTSTVLLLLREAQHNLLKLKRIADHQNTETLGRKSKARHV